MAKIQSNDRFGFIVLALAIFKPFGLEVWQWQAYVHLLAMIKRVRTF